jgi:hypothetical protein
MNFPFSGVTERQVMSRTSLLLATSLRRQPSAVADRHPATIAMVSVDD